MSLAMQIIQEFLDKLEMHGYPQSWALVLSGFRGKKFNGAEVRQYALQQLYSATGDEATHLAIITDEMLTTNEIVDELSILCKIDGSNVQKAYRQWNIFDLEIVLQKAELVLQSQDLAEEDDPEVLEIFYELEQCLLAFHSSKTLLQFPRLGVFGFVHTLQKTVRELKNCLSINKNTHFVEGREQ
jgi:hypothetical protein